MTQGQLALPQQVQANFMACWVASLLAAAGATLFHMKTPDPIACLLCGKQWEKGMRYALALDFGWTVAFDMLPHRVFAAAVLLLIVVAFYWRKKKKKSQETLGAADPDMEKGSAESGKQGIALLQIAFHDSQRRVLVSTPTGQARVP